MKTTTLLIKGMVCNRCVYVLEREMTTLGFEVLDIRLGQVVLKATDDFPQKMDTVELMLKGNGFELLYEKKQKIINAIKAYVEKGIDMQLASGIPTRFTSLISDRLNKNYDTLSTMFSTMEGITLEKYIICRKLEKVKQLLICTEMSLTEIAYALGYSSQAYLSNQLKKYTGFTSSHFKQAKQDGKSTELQK
ncbi:AraC family transcriptional regulator [Sphingobacterium sp. CZ-UAM]|nr:AraC family transcriptional regulator [Sphingobacterium sp. CZ-UAM]